MTGKIEPPFPIWQGFRHSWTYNHRLNRLGDWLEVASRDGDTLEVELSHSAASGSGKDEASFTGFHTCVRAAGVAWKALERTIDIRAKEQKSQAFERTLRLGPDEVPADHDSFAAVLCGFDLVSKKDSDKLISFHLATTPPIRDPASGEVVFSILGALNVDCDSPECDNLSTGEMLVAFIAGAVSGANFGLAGALAGGTLGGVFGELLAKLDLTTDYRLTVRFALISGRADSLASTPHSASNSYLLPKKTAVTRAEKGVLNVSLQGENSPNWTLAVPALTQISLEVTRRKGFLEPDDAMHLLEWDMGVQPVAATGQSCTADVEMFFRNWRAEPSAFLDDQIDLPIIGDIDPLDQAVEGVFSHKDAGSVDLTAGLLLLQFREAAASAPSFWSSSLVWEGKSKDADSPDAERTVTRLFSLELPAQTTPDDTVHRIAVNHQL